jgi:predicted membrane protein
MSAAATSRLSGRVVVGGALILFGLLFTLSNLGLFNAGRVLAWWPLVLIAIGVMKLGQPREYGQRALSIGLIVLGVFFLIQTVLAWRFHDTWPLLLVLAGGMLLWRGLAPRRRASGVIFDSSVLSELVVMGGGNRIVETEDFRGGEATAVMGGIEIDLRRAAILMGPAVVDVFALWGGVELRVPRSWRVDVQVTPLLGGYENKAASAEGGEPAPRLIVRGYAIMGGIGVKN